MNIKMKLDRSVWPLVCYFTVDGKDSSYRATMVAGTGWTLFDGEKELVKNPQLGALQRDVQEAAKAAAEAAKAAVEAAHVGDSQ